MSGGYDTELTVHLQEQTWETAYPAALEAQRVLEAAGFTVTLGPTLPHVMTATGLTGGPEPDPS